jgi:hypothetical protein
MGWSSRWPWCQERRGAQLGLGAKLKTGSLGGVPWLRVQRSSGRREVRNVRVVLAEVGCVGVAR